MPTTHHLVPQLAICGRKIRLRMWCEDCRELATDTTGGVRWARQVAWRLWREDMPGARSLAMQLWEAARAVELRRRSHADMPVQ